MTDWETELRVIISYLRHGMEEGPRMTKIKLICCSPAVRKGEKRCPHLGKSWRCRYGDVVCPYVRVYVNENIVKDKGVWHIDSHDWDRILRDWFRREVLSEG